MFYNIIISQYRKPIFDKLNILAMTKVKAIHERYITSIKDMDKIFDIYADMSGI